MHDYSNDEWPALPYGYSWGVRTYPNDNDKVDTVTLWDHRAIRPLAIRLSDDGSWSSVRRVAQRIHRDWMETIRAGRTDRHGVAFLVHELSKSPL